MAKEGTPVTVTYTVDGHEVTECFALLVVACDPRQVAIADRTPLEKEVCAKLQSFSFHTSLMKGDREPGRPYSGKFHPDNLKAGDGTVYAMRDEVRSHILDLDRREKVRDSGGETLVTVYQLDNTGVPLPVNGPEAKAARKEFERKRDEMLADPAFEWVGFTPRPGSPIETLYEDYFPHFASEDLKAGMPWRVLDAQGDKHTLYVSSFTSFESALHCYEYAELLMQQGHVNRALPRDLDAPIAIVGAGVSGIMFAALQLMRRRGYTNVKLLEREDRHGGKTRTVFEPSPLDGDRIPCELGTCYLSPAYDKMIYLLEEYNAGVKIPLNGDLERPFRAVVDNCEAKTEDEMREGVEFEEWVKRSNGKAGHLPITEKLSDLWVRGELMLALLNYKAIHRAVMGLTRPLPKSIPRPPEDMSKDDPLYEAFEAVLTDTFGEFLDRFNVGAVRGLFTYMYEVQGYGDIEEIPAYYGMVWMTTEVIDGIITTKLPNTREPNSVFAFSEGWLTLWNQIVKKDNLNIVKNVNISRITRC